MKNASLRRWHLSADPNQMRQCAMFVFLLGKALYAEETSAK